MIYLLFLLVAWVQPDMKVIDLSRLTHPRIDLTGLDHIILKGRYEGKAIVLYNGRDCYVQVEGQVQIKSTDEGALVLHDCHGVTVDGAYGGVRSLRLVNGGVVTWGVCNNITVKNLEVINARSAGIKIKNDQLGRESPYYRNVTVKNCLVKGAKYEGIYIGFYTYFKRSGYSANYAHTMRGLKVLNNEVYDCGWDGIQVGCADSSTVIRGNVIRNNGLSKTYGQDFSLCVNSGFSGLIADNECYGRVQIFPYSNTVMRHNYIESSGDYAVFIRTEPNYGYWQHTSPDMSFTIDLNTIKTPGDAVYLLHNNRTGAPVTIRKLVYVKNFLSIGGRELRYFGDLAGYQIDNKNTAKSSQLKPETGRPSAQNKLRPQG